MMADSIDFYQETLPDMKPVYFIALHHPRGAGQFPFKGGDTERLSDTESGAYYAVSFSRICTYLAKALKQ
jgi:hypothetical protein